MRAVPNQVILVTGSTDGLGKRTAHDLAAMGATVILHGRNEEKGKRVLEEIRKSTGSDKLSYYNADFSSLENVRGLAHSIIADWKELHVLINNAGIGTGRLWSRKREVGHDGYELRFTVNYLAPFLLSHLLVPLLKRSAPSRIVNVASLGQHTIDFSDLMLEKHYSPMTAYGQSKLALIMFSFDLAQELKNDGITVNALHPGSLLNTKMVREAFIPMGRAQQGADAEVFMATSPSLEGVTGKFFDQERETRAYDQAYDEEARRMLREISLLLIGLKNDDRTGDNSRLRLKRRIF